ncbi:hypothetical protein AAG906_012419 [Vitis piasezkii]
MHYPLFYIFISKITLHLPCRPSPLYVKTEVVLLSTHGYHTHTSLYHLEQPEDFLVEKTTCCRSRDIDLQLRVHPLTCLHKAFEGHLNLVKGKTMVHERICALSGVETIQSCGSLHSSSDPPMVFRDCSLGTTLRAFSDPPMVSCYRSLGTTLRALRYYLSGLETIQLCGSLHLGTTLRALRYYLSGLEDCSLGTTLRALSLGTTLRALRYYLSGLETIQLCGSLHLGTTLRALRYYLSGLECSTNGFRDCSLGTTLRALSDPPMVSWDCSLGTTLRALRYYLSTTLRALRYYLSGLEIGVDGLFTYFMAPPDFRNEPPLSQGDGDDDGNLAKLLHKIATLVSPTRRDDSVKCNFSRS